MLHNHKVTVVSNGAFLIELILKTPEVIEDKNATKLSNLIYKCGKLLADAHYDKWEKFMYEIKIEFDKILSYHIPFECRIKIMEYKFEELKDKYF